MKFLLLEKLGIPRLRMNDISIFNVFGTIAVACLITHYVEFLNGKIDGFQMSCLLMSQFRCIFVNDHQYIRLFAKPNHLYPLSSCMN